MVLQELGIAIGEIKKLKEGGIMTVESLAYAPKKELLSIKGLSEQKVEKLQSAGKLQILPLVDFEVHEVRLRFLCRCCSLENCPYGLSAGNSYC